MAIHHHHEQLDQQHQEDASFSLDSLYCDEEKWEDDDFGELSEETDLTNNDDNKNKSSSLFTLPLLEQDLFWDDEELHTLFSKEEKQLDETRFSVDLDISLSMARREAVERMLKVNAHYGFSTLTATLAINYLDRFLLSFHFETEEPWMIQLVAVTCLSLAAKVEETHVPLLLDLQVEGTKYVFESKTIQRMELLVLSALKWKMHPVTPLSFLDHIIRRLGLKTHLHWEFLRRCEHLLLSVLSDSRFVGCLPSVLATATMLNVIDQIEHRDGVEYKNQLLGVLKISKDKVDDCYNHILELSNGNNYGHNNNVRKRKYENEESPSSASGVIDAAFSSDGSNDSWAVVGSSLCSSPEPPLKKSRVKEQEMKLSPLNRLIVGIVGSSP